MKFKTLYLKLLMAMAFTSSCVDITETDITESTVQLKAPANYYRSGQLNQHFWWEQLDGAEAYEITIVSPSFDSIGTIVISESLTKTDFILQQLEDSCSRTRVDLTKICIFTPMSKTNLLVISIH